MDEATRQRAIEPFFSTKGIGKGTGLGLSMVHGLVQQLGGALAIRSDEGLGTHVEFWLPESADAAPKPANRDAAPSRAVAAAGGVLLVDDEDLARMSTAGMLADLGYAVTEAVSAEHALSLVEGGFRPDLVVTDHLMPGMTGSDFADAIRRERPGVPILLVSGYAEGEGVAPDLPRLAKPFRGDELAASLAKLTEAAGT